MASHPEPATPPRPERSAFIEQFEKDLKFLQLFLLLINKSCPIKRVDLVWAEDGPAGRVGLRQKTICTENALAGPFANLLTDSHPFEPVFCNIVNDHGKHEAESCAISDRAAMQRVRVSRKPEVYCCHAGLIDIAVPVICDGQHIATLLTGQVLREPPSEAGFAQIRAAVSGLSYIDPKQLETAYWNVPVVSDEDIRSTIEVMEVFAGYLATTWQRLWEITREQQSRHRELQLCRKEFAYIVLEGPPAGGTQLRELMEKIGFAQYPNRVLVVKVEPEGGDPASGASFDIAVARAAQAVEELCERLPNVSCAYLHDRGLCLFFRDRQGTGDSAGIRAQTLASKVLNAIAGRCDLRARAGIGEAKSDWRYLVDSYHEAALALAASDARVAVYTSRDSSSFPELSAMNARVSRLIADRHLGEAGVLIRSMLLEANRELGETRDDIPAQRRFLSYALESMAYAARQLGAAGLDTGESLQSATSIFALHEAFLRHTETIIGSIRQIYAGKRDKVIERARRNIDRMLRDAGSAQSLAIPGIAADLGISAGHLTRLFKRATGKTLERYIMTARVENAKRLLLEPLSKVGEVAETCGFTDSAYFARVFRKLAGCSPTEYREHPDRFPPPQLPGP